MSEDFPPDLLQQLCQFRRSLRGCTYFGVLIDGDVLTIQARSLSSVLQLEFSVASIEAHSLSAMSFERFAKQWNEKG